MERDPGATAGVARLAVGRRDRGDQAEGDRVVDAAGRGVERLGRFALVEVVDEPTGETAAGAGGDAAYKRSPRREVVVARAAAAGAEVEALEGVHETSTRP